MTGWKSTRRSLLFPSIAKIFKSDEYNGTETLWRIKWKCLQQQKTQAEIICMQCACRKLYSCLNCVKDASFISKYHTASLIGDCILVKLKTNYNLCHCSVCSVGYLQHQKFITHLSFYIQFFCLDVTLRVCSFYV